MKHVYTITIFFLLAGLQAPAQIIVKDIFNRNLSGHTIVLTDWEGYMANPATRLTLTAPAGATFPIKVSLSANGALLYFDMPSTASASGPVKTITLRNNNPVSFYISNFPDRDSLDNQYTLTVATKKYGKQNYALKVTDQDLPSYKSPFKITTDFSEDTEYHFFSPAARKNAVVTAANDWAYFITNQNFDTVAAGDQSVAIWGDNGNPMHFAYNPKKYKGFYLYAFGLQVDPVVSGGSPSWDNFQTVNGAATGLRRAGGYNADPRGNYNTLGWSTAYTDSTWFLATNLGDVINDLFSIAHHEIGHCLIFNGGYTVFNGYEQQGYIDDPALLNYTKTKVYVNEYDHLVDSTGNLLADRVSRKGVYGSEYANVVPFGRWLTTKTDLIVLKLIGYNLKNVSAFSKPVFKTTTLPAATAGVAYNTTVKASGGIPFYNFTLSSSTLPPGLSLDAFTGKISGTPSTAGSYQFTIKVMDYDSVSALKQYALTVAAGVLPSQQTVSKLILYPNPTHNYVRVKSDQPIELLIENSAHELLQSKPMGKSFTIDLSSYPAGVYYVIEQQTGVSHMVVKN